MRKLLIMKPDNYRTSAITRKVRCIIILPLLLIFLVCISIMASAQQNDKPVVATVIRINGSLEYRESAGKDWIPAKKGQRLYNGNQLRTGIGNRAVIVYNSGTRILVNENTELEITIQEPGKLDSPERTKLLIGEVYSKVRTDREKQYIYEVETPSSVASVRGTEFNASYAEGAAIFLVISEVVEIMNQLGAVLLEELQTTTVEEGQAPQEPETLSEKAAEKLIEWTEEIEATWKLNIVPRGGTSQEVGTDFALTIWAQNAETGAIDPNATFTLSSFTADSENIEFSDDAGKTWGGVPEITLENGQKAILARGTSEGSVSISAQAEDCEPASITLSFAQAKLKKTIEMKFTDPDGSNEETLLLEFEEK